MPAPRSARSASICTMSTTRAVSDFGLMSPKPTVEKTVTVKYRASVRVIGSVKLAAEFRSITKYVEANSSRKNGRSKASASAEAGLRLLIRLHEQEKILRLGGKIDWRGDLEQSRLGRDTQ